MPCKNKVLFKFREFKKLNLIAWLLGMLLNESPVRATRLGWILPEVVVVFKWGEPVATLLAPHMTECSNRESNSQL